MRLEVVMAATLLLIAVYKYSPLPPSDAPYSVTQQKHVEELFLTFDNAYIVVQQCVVSTLHG